MELGTLIQQSTAFIKNRTSAIRVKLAALFKLKMPGHSSILTRQKTTILVVFSLYLPAVAAIYFLLAGNVNSLQKELLDRGTMIIAQFPENEAANWLARARSSRSDWQVEALFKLKAMVLSAAGSHHLAHALIVDDKDNRIRAHTEESLVGNIYEPVSGTDVLLAEPGVTALKYIDRVSNKEMVDFASPISYGKGERKIRIGSFHFSLQYEEVAKAVSRKHIFFPLITFVTLFLAVSFVKLRDRSAQKKKSLIEADKNRLGPYILEKKIASGGMGELFLARKEIGEFKMRVAVKRILSERADDKEYISSLLDEANLASQLKHPNIVTLHDFGNIRGTYFIAMEYIDGENLLSVMKTVEGEIQIGETIYIMAEVCKGLDYAHNKMDDFTGKPLNIVHRDISPQNILISFEGDVKIVDFGIARAAQRLSKQTTVGIVKGKLHYMSPEQASASGELDKRSDIFSLGIIFYEMITGEKVYKGDTTQEILRLACQAEIPPVSEVKKGMPAELNRIIMKALERELPMRYQTSKEMYNDLMKFTAYNDEFKRTRTDLMKFMQDKFKKEKDDTVII